MWVEQELKTSSPQVAVGSFRSWPRHCASKTHVWLPSQATLPDSQPLVEGRVQLPAVHAAELPTRSPQPCPEHRHEAGQALALSGPVISPDCGPGPRIGHRPMVTYEMASGPGSSDWT